MPLMCRSQPHKPNYRMDENTENAEGEKERFSDLHSRS